jgi:hypothetical protein
MNRFQSGVRICSTDMSIFNSCHKSHAFSVHRFEMVRICLHTFCFRI